MWKRTCENEHNHRNGFNANIFARICRHAHSHAPQPFLLQPKCRIHFLDRKRWNVCEIPEFRFKQRFRAS